MKKSFLFGMQYWTESIPIVARRVEKVRGGLQFCDEKEGIASVLLPRKQLFRDQNSNYL